VTYETERLKD